VDLKAIDCECYTELLPYECDVNVLILLCDGKGDPMLV